MEPATEEGDLTENDKLLRRDHKDNYRNNRAHNLIDQKRVNPEVNSNPTKFEERLKQNEHELKVIAANWKALMHHPSDDIPED